MLHPKGRSVRGTLLWCALWLVAIFVVSCTSRGRANAVAREVHTVEEQRKLHLDDLRSQVLVRIRGYITVSDPVGWSRMSSRCQRTSWLR